MRNFRLMFVAVAAALAAAPAVAWSATAAGRYWDGQAGGSPACVSARLMAATAPAAREQAACQLQCFVLDGRVVCRCKLRLTISCVVRCTVQCSGGVSDRRRASLMRPPTTGGARCGPA
jgi:hypothetical protein